MMLHCASAFGLLWLDALSFTVTFAQILDSAVDHWDMDLDVGKSFTWLPVA